MDEVEPLAIAAAALGESPSWDAADQCLSFVDVVGQRLHRWQRDTGETSQFDLPTLVGAAIPRASGGMLLALGGELVAIDADGRLGRRIDIETTVAGNRLNDAKCDPAGRLYLGSMSGADRPGAGALYRVGADWQLGTVLTGTTISNGLGWSPDGSRMYFADSIPGLVYVFDYDPGNATMTNQRVLIDLDPEHGAPDGLTVDADGHLWIATFGGSSVRRYRPTGELAGVLSLPVVNVTSCAFGGPALDELYITTAAIELDAEQLAKQPLAGRVFRYRPGVTGLPAVAFAG